MSDYFICNGCGKKVSGGEVITGVFYCPMCASVIHKNNGDTKESKNHVKTDFFICYGKDISQVAEVCKHCSNNPANGGSGICHCTLGQRAVY